MTIERERIIQLAKSCDCGYTADENDVLGSSLVGLAAITSFYHAAQQEAFEKAAKLIETPNTLVTKYSIAAAIREMAKEILK